MKEGAYDYVEKGENWQEELKSVVRSALIKKGLIEDYPLKEETAKEDKEENSFCGMIGINREMRKIFDTIKKVSNTPANILILGESGTGKELVARAIHENSSRANKPFIVISNRSIPDNLLESELFGYIKGSFTGAYADKQGYFDLANGGTIFLDEVSNYSVALQTQLSRVIQEKTFRRIGGTEDITVDVRIISATNKNLNEKVQQAEFCEDLYYRLNVIPIFIPPLRERREDIPLLINSFIDKYSKMFGKQSTNISSYVMELLMNYDFPGNVRELQNIIERGVAMGSSNIILPDSLPFGTPKFDIDMTENGLDLNYELDKFEKGLIEKALQITKGSKKKAADLLKISFDSLRHRIDKLGIE
jgi:two-component system response regulator PilR (NtrC family)